MGRHLFSFFSFIIIIFYSSQQFCYTEFHFQRWVSNDSRLNVLSTSILFLNIIQQNICWLFSKANLLTCCFSWMQYLSNLLFRGDNLFLFQTSDYRCLSIVYHLFIHQTIFLCFVFIEALYTSCWLIVHAILQRISVLLFN